MNLGWFAHANASDRGWSRRGGVVVWLLGAAVCLAAVLILGWMLLLPWVVQARFGAATGTGLELRGLAVDPFSGMARVSGWILRASTAPGASILARGGPAHVVAPVWWAARGAEGEWVVDELDLHLFELRLIPDAHGRWPVLGVAAALGMPYERGGLVGEGPRLRIRDVRLRVDTLFVQDAASGGEVSVRVNWRGRYSDLDHLQPVVVALLAAGSRLAEI